MRKLWIGAVFLAGLIALTASANAQTPTEFDPVAATDAYLATISDEDRAKSDAYFEGGYWLILWDLLYGLAIAWLLLARGRAARIRDWCERRSKRPFLQTFLFAAVYVALASFLTLPWSIYRGFIREHQYDLATQTIGAWFGDWVTSFVIGLIMFSLFITVIYALIRRAKEKWWIWGAGFTGAFFVIVVMISPVFIAPLFNEYKPLDDPKIESPILAMAEAQGVAFDRVYVFDASAQTTRISANVSGMGATKRISLNDNLLNQGTLAEIKAVMGHELGHYVLQHSYSLVVGFTLIFAFAYFLATKAFPWAVDRFGHGWNIRGIDDVAGLPLAAALLSVVFTLLTPATNSLIRYNESEADLYGLNVAKEPDGFATIALKLGTYRKLDPSPLEEVIFFDHPSGRTRIQMAMDWKAEQMGKDILQ